MSSEDSDATDKKVWVTPSQQDAASPETANIISSVVTEVGDTKYHRVLLDLDVEHHYVPSSTPGHAHLFINVLLPHEKYRNLLITLKECGILGEGTATQIDRDGMTSLRLPGIKKGINDGSVHAHGVGYCFLCETTH